MEFSLQEVSSSKAFIGLSLCIGTTPRGGRVVNQIPADILEDSALNEAIKIVYSRCVLKFNTSASTEL
jgi:hypothetical protein